MLVTTVMGNSHSKSKYTLAQSDDPVSFHKRDEALAALKSFLEYPYKCDKHGEDSAIIIYLSTNQPLSVGISPGNLDDTTRQLGVNGFGWMGEAAAVQSAATVKPQGKRAVAIAKQLITHWALYHKVAFEELVILVCGNEVRSFLKVKVCNPQLTLLTSAPSIDGFVEGQNYGGEKGGGKQEVVVHSREL